MKRYLIEAEQHDEERQKREYGYGSLKYYYGKGKSRITQDEIKAWFIEQEGFATRKSAEEKIARLESNKAFFYGYMKVVDYSI